MSPNLTVHSKHSVGKRIAANTGLMMGSKITSVVLGLGSIFIATKVLGQNELGIILFLHAYMLFFSEVTAFQSWHICFKASHPFGGRAGHVGRTNEQHVKREQYH